MLKQKRSKFSRMRGSMTHGGGHKKKRRGAGHRGGVGLSGTGARGDAQKSGLLAKNKGILKKYSAIHGVKLKDITKSLSKRTYFGKRGFASINKKKNKTISLKTIEENFDKMIESGLITKKGNEYIFDSIKAGYDKILGNTKFSKKISIICNEISANTKERIENNGGKIILPESN